MPAPDHHPADTVKRLARELGFDDCRIAAARPATHAAEFRQWIADGHHGDMAWLARNPQRRCDPREVLPGCRSIVCLALNYFPGDHPRQGRPRQGRFSEASGGVDSFRGTGWTGALGSIHADWDAGREQPDRSENGP